MNFEKIPRGKSKLVEEVTEAELELQENPHRFKSLLRLPPESHRIDELCEQFEYDISGEFIPELALKEILAMRPGPEKDGALELLKERLAIQYFGFMTLNDEIYALAKESPDAGSILVEKVKALIEKFREKYHFNKQQMDRINAMVYEFEYKNAAVTEFFKDNNSDANQMFESLYYKKPVKKVECCMGPVSVSFIFSDLDDYTELYAQKRFQHERIEESEKERAQKSGGVSLNKAPAGFTQLEGTIIGVKNKGLWVNDVLVHEEQHAYNRIFRNTITYIEDIFDLSLYIAKDSDSAKELVAQHCYNQMNNAFEWAKDEILAYKSEPNRTGILEILTKTKKTGGLYDYFDVDNLLENISTQAKQFEKSEEINKLAHHLVVDKYKEGIQDGINAYSSLIKKGYVHHEIVGLLMPYALKDWSKISERTLSAKELLGPRKLKQPRDRDYNEEQTDSEQKTNVDIEEDYPDYVVYEYPITDILSDESLKRLKEKFPEIGV